jgi:hypothetical protein
MAGKKRLAGAEAGNVSSDHQDHHRYCGSSVLNGGEPIVENGIASSIGLKRSGLVQDLFDQLLP